MRRRPTSPNRTDTPYPYTTLFRSNLRLDHLLSKEFGGKRWPLWSEELHPFQRTFAAVLMSLHPGDRHSETVAIAEQACMPKSGPSGACEGKGDGSRWEVTRRGQECGSMCRERGTQAIEKQKR